MLRLRTISGPDAGRVHELPPEEPQILGRSTEALPCTDRAVSRRHAELTPRDGLWLVRDLASKGGTFVNGARIHGHQALRAGDRVRVGETVLMVERADGTLGVPPTTEQLAAMGEAVATVSHSIKNMLQGLRSGADAVELALSRHDLEMAQKGWPIVARNLDRVMQVTLNMLAFAKDRPLDPEPMLLDSVVDEACALAEAALRRRGGSLERTRAEGLVELPIDLVAVHQTLLNLLMNAVDAAPEKAPRVAVSTHWIHPSPRWPSGAVATIVRDDGPGVPEAMHERLFQPFATSKGQRGTGLGLVVARKLALLHGGAVEHAGNGDAWPTHPVLGGQVRAADAGGMLPGAAFVLVLPAASAQDADETRAPKPIPGGDLGVRFGA